MFIVLVTPKSKRNIFTFEFSVHSANTHKFLPLEKICNNDMEFPGKT